MDIHLPSSQTSGQTPRTMASIAQPLKTYLDLLALGCPASLLRALLPLLGLVPLDAVDGECDAGGRVLRGRVRHAGRRHLLIPALCGAALPHYAEKKAFHHAVYRGTLQPTR